jgi:putative flippase GtrA
VKLTVRFGRYTLIGAAGTALQLGVLALLDRCAPGHYLWASAAALETALLHNFAWHSCYTWRDRRDARLRMKRLIRFHLTTGAVSLAGNLVFMRLFVASAHIPVLAANFLAILCCSFANFCAANHWAFAATGSGQGNSQNR